MKKPVGKKDNDDPMNEDNNVRMERIELVKIFRQAIEHTVGERNFFVRSYAAVLIACATGYGYLMSKADHGAQDVEITIGLCLFSLVVCAAWSMHMEVYRILIAAKHRTLDKIEEKLSIKIHNIEWQEREKFLLTAKFEWQTLKNEHKLTKQQAEEKYKRGPTFLSLYPPTISNSDFIVMLPRVFIVFFLLMMGYSLYIIFSQ